jgi:hypothetical protein
VLQLLCHQLELVSLFSAVIQFLAQNQQCLGFALQLASQGCVLKCRELKLISLLDTKWNNQFGYLGPQVLDKIIHAVRLGLLLATDA